WGGRPRRRGWELLAVGLAGLLIGAMLGAGTTAIALIAIGNHRHGGAGWFNQRGGPGPLPRRYRVYPPQPGAPYPYPVQPQPAQPQPAAPSPTAS
ncbi:MAG: hypothetical protein J2P15_18430, partial [Micromonosporaceae bacterium]|nr:hypothetical protein [Micromonosporaceae bacterium]